MIDAPETTEECAENAKPAAKCKVPKNLMDAVKRFADPETAWTTFRDMRWPDGVTCPFCECKNVSFISTRKTWKCRSCTKQFSVKTRSVMHGSPLPIEKWLIAMWLISHCKNGISSYEMAETLGVSQPAAWFMGHRIRKVMAAKESEQSEKLTGEVEADETYVGGRAAEMHADRRRAMREQGFPKIIVMGMRQRDGMVRTRVVADTTKETLQGIIHESIDPSALLYTDSSNSYNGIEETYCHTAVNHKAGEYVRGCAYTNGIENYWTGLKRTYHGSYIHYSAKHAALYLAEQEFRFNNRKMKDGERFVAIAGRAGNARTSYRDLVAA